MLASEALLFGMIGTLGAVAFATSCRYVWNQDRRELARACSNTIPQSEPTLGCSQASMVTKASEIPN